MSEPIRPDEWGEEWRAPEDDSESKLLSLQIRFLSMFSWLRRSVGLTQREVAGIAGWKQPYVARLEDERSPLLGVLSRLERYADACGATGVLVFVDQQTGQVRRTLALGDAGVEAAESISRSSGATRDEDGAWIEVKQGDEMESIEGQVMHPSRSR
jgi:transcriptional regulator with XRE-family HTH domain